MKKMIATISFILLAFSLFAQTKWVADTSQTNIRFTATHLGVSEVDGHFTTYDGAMVSTKPDFTDAQIYFLVSVNSINTNNGLRDNHLKSPDFFDAQKYPQIKFKSTSFKKISDKQYSLEGDLTIRDVTKHVTFDVTYGGTVNDAEGKTKAGFTATTTINRFDYKLNWNKITEAIAVVNSDVAVTISLEFTKQK
ncbi:MAG: YceI family protein [Chitinophagales bacterium]|nr:YceI family protein [Chitinophagales bacterium]